jgi:chaperone modulatory protein CbpM
MSMDETRMLPQVCTNILEEQTELTLTELSQACAVQVDAILELVDEGVLSPHGQARHHWRFTGIHLRQAMVAIRLQRDLGVNLAGAALALQLLDELEILQARLRRAGTQ